MPRVASPPLTLRLPAKLDPDALPRFPTRRQMEQIHRHYFGPVSARSIQEWPLTWRLVNGHAVADINEFLKEAQRRLDAAPSLPRRRAESAERPAA